MCKDRGTFHASYTVYVLWCVRSVIKIGYPSSFDGSWRIGILDLERMEVGWVGLDLLIFKEWREVIEKGKGSLEGKRWEIAPSRNFSVLRKNEL